MHATNHPTTGAPAPTPTTPARQGLASQADACKFLGVSRQALWKWATQGRIQPIALGRLTRYRWADLESIASDGLPPASKKGGAK